MNLKCFHEFKLLQATYSQIGKLKYVSPIPSFCKVSVVLQYHLIKSLQQRLPYSDFWVCSHRTYWCDFNAVQRYINRFSPGLKPKETEQILGQVFQYILKDEFSVTVFIGTLMSGLDCAGITLHHYNHSSNASVSDLSFIVYWMAESQGCLDSWWREALVEVASQSYFSYTKCSMGLKPFSIACRGSVKVTRLTIQETL